MSDKTMTRANHRRSTPIQDFVDGAATVLDLTGSLTERSARQREKALRAIVAEFAEKTSRDQAGIFTFTKRVGAFLSRAGIVAARDGYDSNVAHDPPSRSNSS